MQYLGARDIDFGEELNRKPHLENMLFTGVAYRMPRVGAYSHKHTQKKRTVKFLK